MKDEALRMAKAWFERNTYGDEAVEEYEAIEKALAAQPEHPEQMARLGWQYVECPACGSEGARAFPKPEQEPVGRTNRQIVDETEKLAAWLLSWSFNHQSESKTPMRESTHPFAKSCWAAACHIQEMLTATDPENAVAELEGDAGEEAAPQPAQQEPEIVQRVKRYAGQTLRTARNPNITARECIELANWFAAHGIKENT